MYLKTESNMKLKEKGLTVGELTMAIGALLIAGLLWATINKKNESKNISRHSMSPSISIEAKNF